MMVSTSPLRVPRMTRRSSSMATTGYCSSKIDIISPMHSLDAHIYGTDSCRWTWILVVNGRYNTVCTTGATSQKMLRSECTLVTIDQPCQRAVLHYGVMKAEKEAMAVRGPTCGASPREKCELNTGLPRTEPHPARRLAAEKE